MATQKKILIVEDNELNMKLFSDLLRAHNIEVIETRDGLKVMELTRSTRPDLILMDIQLPEISGLELTRKLKEDTELSDIPIVAVTAFAMKGDEEKIMESGCEGYLSKPITVNLLMETINRYI